MLTLTALPRFLRNDKVSGEGWRVLEYERWRIQSVTKIPLLRGQKIQNEFLTGLFKKGFEGLVPISFKLLHSITLSLKIA